MVSKSCIQREKNVFCEPFSVLLVLDKDANEAYCPERIVHTDSPDWLAFCNGGHSNRDIEFIRLSGLAGTSMPGLVTTTASSTRTAAKTSVTAASLDYLRDITLRGHSGSLQSIWFLFTQKLLLSAGFDISIRLWDLSPDFSPNRSRYIRIFAGHQDTVLCLWVDANNCKESLHLPTDTTSVAQKSNEPILTFASGSADCTCKIWKTDSKEACMNLEHASPVTAVYLAGSTCATGEFTGQLTIWQLLWQSGIAQVMKVSVNCVFTCKLPTGSGKNLKRVCHRSWYKKTVLKIIDQLQPTTLMFHLNTVKIILAAICLFCFYLDVRFILFCEVLCFAVFK
ncbi:unnamed protein product [Schistocephalus solidus]|uniref:WD_REPEATS_REGION domain-containing protein n=1 Tax=Schistocephalus solidus TaxID=70667 RepID=A0A183TBY4_SCHSO|nr:unnamed protein product [Schistocephalus solidus]